MSVNFDIGLDIDDCLFAWSSRVHAACDLAGVTNGKGPSTRWATHEHYGCTRDEFWAVVEREYDNGMLLKEPYEYVLRELTVLKMLGHRVHLITARGFEGARATFIRQQTREWVLKYNLPVDSLSFLQDKTKFTGLDYFLDDNAGHVLAMRELGVEAYLHEQPHNRAAEHTIPRMTNLSTFVEMVCREQHAMSDPDVQVIGDLA